MQGVAQPVTSTACDIAIGREQKEIGPARRTEGATASDRKQQPNPSSIERGCGSGGAPSAIWWQQLRKSAAREVPASLRTRGFESLRRLRQVLRASHPRRESCCIPMAQMEETALARMRSSVSIWRAAAARTICWQTRVSRGSPGPRREGKAGGRNAQGTRASSCLRTRQAERKGRAGGKIQSRRGKGTGGEKVQGNMDAGVEGWKGQTSKQELRGEG